MRVHVLQNEAKEYIGSMQSWFESKGYSVTTTYVYAGEPLPLVHEFDWLVIMGGSMSVYETDKYLWIDKTKSLIRACLQRDKRVLGICLGGQLIASALGANVYANDQSEIGWFPILKSDSIATWLPENTELLCWHGDCFDTPDGAVPFASSHITPCQGFCINKRVWALQFHLEVDEATPDIFLSASGGELGKGAYIQNYSEIKNASANISKSKGVMHALLEEINSA